MSPKNVDSKNKKEVHDCYNAIMSDKVDAVGTLGLEKISRMKFTDVKILTE